MPRAVLVIACGAIAHELVAVIQANQFSGIDIECLPAHWHNTPELIAPAVEAKIIKAKSTGRYTTLWVAYGDCGTGGMLDTVLSKHDVQRLPGDHCYSFFAGREQFDAMVDEELGTFYLTDYLVDNFDRLILEGLGITRYPELRDQYFAHYKKLMYLMQNTEETIAKRRLEKAQCAADALGLQLSVHSTGLQPFEQAFRHIQIARA